MTKIITLTTAAATALALSACGATVEQKAASGAIAGAVVGGPVGAAVGVRPERQSARRKSRTKTALIDARSYRRACDQGCGAYLLEVLRPRRRDAPNDASSRFAGCEP